MKTAEEIIIEKIGEWWWISGKHQPEIIAAMEEYALQLQVHTKRFYSKLIENKIRAATYKAFIYFEPFIESENAIDDLDTMHEEWLKTFKFDDNANEVYCDTCGQIVK